MAVEARETQPEDRPEKERAEGSNWTTYVQTAATIGAGIVGLTAYVYILGGIVLWLRLTAARLPADDVMDAFQDRQLLSAGMKALFFELLLLAVVLLLVWGAWRVACWLELRRRQRAAGAPAQKREEPLDEYVLLVMLRSVVAAITVMALVATAFEVFSEDNAVWFSVAAAVAGLLIGAANVADRRPKSPARLSGLPENAGVKVVLQVARALISLGVVYVALLYMAAPLGLTVLVLVVLLQFSTWVVKLTRVKAMKELIVPVLILAIALNVVIVSYLSTPPVTFERATVKTRDGTEWVGAYVGRADGNLYLATCRPVTATTSTEARMRVIPDDEIERFVLGGFRYSFDFGKRPSLLGLFKYYAQATSIERNDDGFQLDLREERDVCGKNS
jgi:hypothetical protein